MHIDFVSLAKMESLQKVLFNLGLIHVIPNNALFMFKVTELYYVCKNVMYHTKMPVPMKNHYNNTIFLPSQFMLFYKFNLCTFFLLE